MQLVDLIQGTEFTILPPGALFIAQIKSHRSFFSKLELVDSGTKKPAFVSLPFGSGNALRPRINFPGSLSQTVVIDASQAFGLQLPLAPSSYDFSTADLQSGDLLLTEKKAILVADIYFAGQDQLWLCDLASGDYDKDLPIGYFVRTRDWSVGPLRSAD